jgi:transposase-like protein
MSNATRFDLSREEIIARYRQRIQKGRFIRDYSYRGYLPAIKQQIADMAVNGSGIRDIARVLRISDSDSN